MLFNEIIDKIPKEADINTRQYSVTDRIQDVNDEYFYLIEYAGQLGSKFPITDGSTVEQEETLVSGDNTFTRDIPNVGIAKVEFKGTGQDKFYCMDHEPNRCRNCYCLGDMRFTANEKKFTVIDALAGTVKLTVERPAIVKLTQADYDAGDVEIEWIPEEFHPLLWLKPAMKQAGYYKKDRYSILQKMYDDLFDLFVDHYERFSAIDTEMRTENQRGNNR